MSLFVVDGALILVFLGILGSILNSFGLNGAVPYTLPNVATTILLNFFYAASVLMCLFAMGLYQRRYMHGRALVRSGTIAAFLSWVGWLFFDDFVAGDRSGFFYFTVGHFTLFALLALARPLTCFYYATFATKRRLAVIGSEKVAQLVNQAANNVAPSEFVVVQHHAMDCAAHPDRMLGVLRSLKSSAEFDDIYVEMPDSSLDVLVEGLPRNESGGQTPFPSPVAHLFERYCRWIEPDVMNNAELPSLHNAGHRFFWIKRVVETLITCLGVLLVLPLIVLTIIAIKLDDGGPIFYRQTRVGKNGRHFSVLKFRSMIVDAESGGAQWARVGDSRVTRVGSFLRKSRIDELPQLFNILKGEMALVGPRPERPEFVEALAKAIPGFDARHVVRPGLTGWAQISYSYGSSLEDARWKARFDIYYIKNWTIWLDLAIVAQTIRVVLLAEGSR
nr:sugar transferase [Aquicoccus sp. G2-2]MEA1114617.1 sugar transferase [Aquicoccus sp. G2-2]